MHVAQHIKDVMATLIGSMSRSSSEKKPQFANDSHLDALLLFLTEAVKLSQKVFQKAAGPYHDFTDYAKQIMSSSIL